jgi:hypothetical protein
MVASRMGRRGPYWDEDVSKLCRRTPAELVCDDAEEQSLLPALSPAAVYRSDCALSGLCVVLPLRVLGQSRFRLAGGTSSGARPRCVWLKKKYVRGFLGGRCGASPGLSCLALAGNYLAERQARQAVWDWCLALLSISVGLPTVRTSKPS